MKQILKRIFHHEELTREEACTLMQRMTGGEMNEAQTAALLAAFQMRGVKVDELVGFRDALLQACVPVDLHEFHPIDIVGTGGDGKKHLQHLHMCLLCRGRSRLPGSQARKLRSHFGEWASNVMERYGVKFTNDADKLKHSIEQCGMAYLHAPLFHPALKTVAPVRKALGVRTPI